MGLPALFLDALPFLILSLGMLRFRFPSRLLNLFLPWCARQQRGSLAFFSLADLLQLAILINIIIEIGANSIEIGRT